MRVQLSQDECGCPEPTRTNGSVLCQKCLGNLPKPKTPNVGDVYAVIGGYGLMQVAAVDDAVVSMRGHGPKDSRGYWFYLKSLGHKASPETIIQENREAKARNVGCNNPDCWCRDYVK